MKDRENANVLRYDESDSDESVSFLFARILIL